MLSLLNIGGHYQKEEEQTAKLRDSCRFSINNRVTT